MQFFRNSIILNTKKPCFVNFETIFVYFESQTAKEGGKNSLICVIVEKKTYPCGMIKRIKQIT